MMQNDDNDLPPAEVPMELPSALPGSDEPVLESKEFLVSDPEHSVDPEKFAAGGENAAAGDESAPPNADDFALGSPEAAAAEVDALLSAEVLPEGIEAAILEPAPALPEQPTFQLQFRTLTDDTRAALKKALDTQAVAVTEKAWAAAVPVISQLTEFQAISLLQTARALGVPAEATVALPGAMPSEEDLALGDLLGVPDAASVSIESAPSVTLPKGEKEVLLCTPESLPGGIVRESFGIVVAHRSIARRLFREEDLREKLQKELRGVPKGPSVVLPSSQLQILLRELMLDLRKLALAKGANSVLGVKIEAFPESGRSDPQLEQLRLVAFGTAAVVEKS